MIDLITGAAVSSVTFLVTVVVFPDLSFATIVIVLDPLTRVTSLLNVPSVATVTAVPFTVTVTGFDVISSVLPVMVTVFLFVTRLSTGAVTDNVGGTVSIVNVAVFAADAFPSLSLAVTDIVCAPSDSAVDGV